MGVSQQTISQIDQSESVEEEILDKIAKALGVIPQAIKSFSEDAIINTSMIRVTSATSAHLIRWIR